jgi:hypothetical protein
MGFIFAWESKMKTLMCCLSLLLLAGCFTIPDNPIARNNNAITASVGGERIAYAEAIGDSEKGAMRAAALSYSIDSGALMMDISAKYAHGNDVTYNGAIIQTGAPLSFDHPSTMEDAAIQFGGLIPSGGHFQWGLLAQTDYHYWDRNDTTNPAGYDEKYRHYDVGGALLFQWWTGRVVFSFSPSVLFMVDPHMTASDLPGAPGFNHTFELQPTVGGGLDFKTSFNVTRHQSLSLDLNGLYYYYVESSAYMGLFEPNSHTYVPSVLLGYSILL